MTLTSSRHSVADQSLDAHIALLWSLRRQTIELSVDARGVDYRLEREFRKVLFNIDRRLGAAMLRGELKRPMNNDLVLERLPSGEHAWLRREERD